MITLVSGVVLLTYKKPEKKPLHSENPSIMALPRIGTGRKGNGEGDDEQEALRDIEEGDGEADMMWQIGDAEEGEDEEDGPRSRSPLSVRRRVSSTKPKVGGEGEEEHMLPDREEGEEGHRESTSSDATLARPDSAPAYTDEFGTWEHGKAQS